MRKILIVSCLMALVSTSAFAQFNAVFLQPVDSILKVNANAIKRLEESELIIEDMEKATFKQKLVYTILNQKGDDFMTFSDYTDKFKKLDDVTITFFNALGIPEKVYHKKDLKKQASVGSFLDDATIYWQTFRGFTYPTNVQIEYSTRYKGLVSYPSFDIQSPGESVVNASFTVTVPTALNIRYHPQKINTEPTVENNNGNTRYVWQVKNLAAFVEEDFTATASSRYPKVLIAPNQFKMDDYAGSMQSWQSFGQWISKLSSKALDLPEATKTQVRSMVANIDDPKEKARILYQYLQDNFRYISIQLGIGGLKTFPASFTETKKYGDCKALSTLMQAYLDAVGIRSYTALINGGDNEAPVPEAFPVNEFNHMILCIPFEKDSVWLECTSSYTDFNKLGNFTENKKALLITENGGVLVNTPKSKPEENTLGVYSTVKMQDDGTGTVQSKLYSSGEYKLTMVYWMHHESQKDQQDALLSILHINRPPTFDVSWSGNIRSEMVETGVNMTVDKVAAIKAGSRLFLNKHPFHLTDRSLPTKDNRMNDYYFPNPFIKSDTTVYELPAGYEVASFPKEIKLDTKYASYRSISKLNEQGNVISIATLRLNEHIIPAADFVEMRKFIGEVIEDENQKIVISKQ